REQRRRNVSRPQAAQRPKDNERQNAHIHSRHHKNVIGARALEVRARIAIDERLLADDHGIDQRRFARRPKLVHLGNHAGVHSVAQALKAAAGKSWEQLYVLDLRRAQSCDAAMWQISLVVESAGIAEIARRLQLGQKSNAIPVVKSLRQWGGGSQVSGIVRIPMWTI